jgi:peptidoglycan/LPS O-acetylase OafA/YrhL
MLEKTAALRIVSAQRSETYRPDIDGLRAIAVCAVVAFHAFPMWLRSGFIGVDIFFVISGYLISGHIFSALGNGTFSIHEFYAKRIRRIFPALVTVLLASSLFGWIALLSDEYKQLGKHVAAGASFVSNLALWFEAGYFDTTAITKPLLHLWSLGIEEQFYIVWPLAAMTLNKLRSNILAVIVFFAGLSFALNTYFIQSDTVLTFFSPLTRFWELLAGVALAQQESDDQIGSPWLRDIQSIIGICLIGVGLVLIRESNQFPGWWATVPVVGTVLSIAAGRAALVNRTLLNNRILVGIGLISYPLYLWHWPLLSFARIIEGDFPSRIVRIVLVVFAFALAGLTYFFVEKPLRFGGHKRLKISALMLGMASVGALGYWSFINNGLPGRGMIREMAAVNAEFEGPLWPFAKNEICELRYPFPEAHEYGWWFCAASKDAPPTVLLIGNSFANHLYPGIVDAMPSESVLSIGACPPFEVDRTSIPFNAASGNSPCAGPRWYHQQNLIDGIVKAAKPRLVIIAGIDPHQGVKIEALRKRIDFMEQQGARVVVFWPHARPDGDIKSCFARPFKAPQKSCEISPVARKKLADGFSPIMRDIKATNPNVDFFDPTEALCPAGECSFVANGLPTIRDQYGHFSRHGSQIVAEKFLKWIHQSPHNQGL